MLSYLCVMYYASRVPIPLPLSTRPLRAPARAPQIAATFSQLARDRSGYRNPAGLCRIYRWKFDILNEAGTEQALQIGYSRYTVC
jgi:hypothetical protein